MRFLYRSITLPLWVVLLVLFGVINASALSLDEVRNAMPPENGLAADAFFNQVLAGDDALIFALCNLIGPPEETPDAKAHYALYGLAKHVVGPGREAQRVRVARIFEVALNRVKHPDVQRFFMAQLRICGDATTMRVLESYVCDPVVYDDAVRTIAAIGGLEGVASLLMLECPEVPEKNASIQNAIFGLNAQPYYSVEETGLSPELVAAMALPDSVEDNNRIIALCREALGKEGLQPRYGAMVLQNLVRLAGKDALPELLQAMNSPHSAYWGTALALAENLSGEDVSQAWVTPLAEFNETVRPRVIAMLGKREDPVARQAVREAMGNPDLEVRLAAYESVNRHSESALAGPLMNALAQADTNHEIQAIKGAFLRLPDLERVMHQELADRPVNPENYSPKEKTAYLEMIAEKQAVSFKNIPEGLAADPDDRVRCAAYAALAAVGDQGHLALLYQCLLGEQNEAEADAARTSITALAKRLNLGEDAVAQAVALLSSASGDTASRLFKTLGVLANPAALKAVQAAAEPVLFVAAPDMKLAETILETLGLWPDPEAGIFLLGIWQRFQDENLRLITLKQYLVHVQRNFSEPIKQRELLSGAEGLCKTDAERQAIAEAIAKASEENK